MPSPLPYLFECPPALSICCIAAAPTLLSQIRRRQFGGTDIIRFGNLEFRPSENILTAGNGNSSELTKKEHDLLLYFIANPGRILTKAAIAEHLWGDYMDLADHFDLVYTHVKNLRKKMKQLGGGSTT